METGVRSQKLQDIYDSIPAPRHSLRYNWEDMPEPDADLSCIGCRTVVPTFLNYRRVLKWSEDRLAKAAIDICTGFGIEKENVCVGAIYGNLPSMVYVIDNEPRVNAINFCAIAFQGSCGSVNDPAFDFEITVDENGPVAEVIN